MYICPLDEIQDQIEFVDINVFFKDQFVFMKMSADEFGRSS